MSNFSKGIRKRSYHRALKRGEQWAKNKKMTHEIDAMLYSMANKILKDMIYKENPFQKLVGLQAWLDEQS